MKKIMLLGAAVVMLSVTACKKDYTCQCKTVDDTTGDQLGDTIESTSKMKKSDAESWCNTSTTAGGFTTTCSLK